VNRVVPLDTLDATVDALAAKIAGTSADTLARGKRAFYAQIGRDERDAYALASAVMCENAATPDAREGIAAFLAKRRAIWRS
jgi:enoyl-CoA hydratase/carnithine racemase